jgi:hypothetical protein
LNHKKARLLQERKIKSENASHLNKKSLFSEIKKIKCGETSRKCKSSITKTNAAGKENMDPSLTSSTMKLKKKIQKLQSSSSSRPTYPPLQLCCLQTMFKAGPPVQQL